MGVEYLLHDQKNNLGYELGKGAWYDFYLNHDTRRVGPRTAEEWHRLFVTNYGARFGSLDAKNVAHRDLIAFETYLFCVHAGWDVVLLTEFWEEDIEPLIIRTRYTGEPDCMRMAAQAFKGWMKRCGR